MMSLVSKIKNLIEFAKCGKGLYQMYEKQPADLYIVNEQFLFNTANLIQIKESPYIRSIKGTVKLFGEGNSAYPLNGLPNLEEIDLPECTTIHKGGGYIFGGCTKLHTAKLPSMTKLSNLCLFDGCIALKYIEVGALTSMNDRALLRCTNVEEFIVGKGTKCSLYLQYCAYLSDECIQSIIDNIAVVSTAQTLNFHEDVKAKLTEVQLETITSKNWSVA